MSTASCALQCSYDQECNFWISGTTKLLREVHRLLPVSPAGSSPHFSVCDLPTYHPKHSQSSSVNNCYCVMRRDPGFQPMFQSGSPPPPPHTHHHQTVVNASSGSKERFPKFENVKWIQSQNSCPCAWVLTWKPSDESQTRDFGCISIQRLPS